jgi:uncharacterized membrane protein HdeD (DUF308 family)
MPELRYTLAMLSGKASISSLFVMEAGNDPARALALKTQIDQILNSLTKVAYLCLFLGIISVIVFFGIFITLFAVVRLMVIQRARPSQYRLCGIHGRPAPGRVMRRY